MMEELPNGWTKTKLSQIAQWGSGGTPSRKKPHYFSGNIPWIKTGELGSKYVRGAEEHITEEAIKKSSAKVFPKGSVGIAMYGATIGKVSIWGIDASTNQACAVAKCYSELIDNEFLYYLLFSEKRGFINSGKGGAQPNISQGLLKEWAIFLPPLNEQKRIVAKIEELFSELDNGLKCLKTTASLLEALYQSALDAAFKEITDYKLLPDLLSEKLSNGYSGKPVKYKTGHKVLSLSSTTSGIFDGSHYKFLDEEGLEDRNIWCQPNDIFVQRGNTIEYVGVPAIYTGKLKEFIFPDLMIRLRANENIILTKFLYYVLSSPSIRNYMREKSKGSAGTMPKINQAILSSINIPFCSLGEQLKIVQDIEKKLSIILSLKETVQEHLKKSEALRQSILKKAFSGKLIPQDQTDEPASVLLERIKAEKEKLSAKPKKKSKKRKTAA